MTGLGTLPADFEVHETTFIPGPNFISVAKADATRFAIIFSNTGTVAIRVSVNPAGSGAPGLNLPVNGTGLLFNFRDHGALTTLAWSAIGGMAGVGLTVTEVFYRPSGNSTMEE